MWVLYKFIPRVNPNNPIKKKAKLKKTANEIYVSTGVNQNHKAHAINAVPKMSCIHRYLLSIGGWFFRV
jgi:hypothetical protein